jgi:hypothetical protein
MIPEKIAAFILTTSVISITGLSGLDTGQGGDDHVLTVLTIVVSRVKLTI